MEHASPEVIPEFSTLIDLLEWRASRQPDRRVFTFLADGEEEAGSLDLGEIAERARALGAWLTHVGLAGQRILLLFPAGLDFVTAYLGCAYAGAIAIPAPPPNPARLARTMPRLQGIVADAEPAAVLTDREGLALSNAVSASLPGGGARMRWLAVEDCPPALGRDWRRPDLVPAAPAHLQYTSGSTASPKGTVIRHENLLENSRFIHAAKRYTPESQSVVWVPNYHDDGLVHGLLQPIYAGCRCVLLPASAFVARPERWLRAISHYRATHSGGPNFAYELCLRKVSDSERAGLDLSSWIFAYNAAEPVRKETLRGFFERFAPSGFRWSSFAPCYGLAEATLTVSVGLRDEGPRVVTVDGAALERTGSVRQVPENGPGARTLVGCGRPVGTTEIVLVAPETMARVTPGCVGEILVRNACVAEGYLNRPEESARTFEARVAGTGEGPYLRTGDLGFLLDGELFITGRHKDLIIIRGENRYPQDIEWTVERCHPAVRPGGVAAFPIEAQGEERLAIAVEVQPPPAGAEPGGTWAQAIHASIRQAVSEKHELRPQAIALLPAGAIPKTSSGKIQRRACRAAFLDLTLGEFDRWTSASSATAQPEPSTGGAVELWPSVAEYFVYDEVIYAALTHDERRNESYRVALERAVPGKVVLDIGTGRDAILARLCVACGARKVYAIELLEASFLAAQARVRELGLEDHITILHGDATRVELPEKVDVCVSELVGAIGSMEGVIPILNDAFRFLNEGGVMIPWRSVSRIAPVTLPDALLAEPGFHELPGHYVHEIFAQVGHPFDLRLCVKNLSPAHLLAEPGIFEDLVFTGPLSAEYAHPSTFRVNRSGRLDGLLIWLVLHTIEGETIDVLANAHCWLPIFVPVFDPGIQVAEGDVLEIESRTTLNKNGLNPDYRVTGRLLRRGAEPIAFDWISPHDNEAFRASRFYERLFPGGEPRIWSSSRHAPPPRAPVPAGASAKEIQAWLSRYLSAELGVAAHEIELDRPFSQLGMDSVAATRLAADLGAWFGVALPPTTAWSHPSVLALSEHLCGAPGRERAPSAPRHESLEAEPIAIVGMGCRLPGGVRSLEEFWCLLEGGGDAITEVPPDRFDIDAHFDPEPGAPGKTYSRWGGFVDGIADFDPEFFGVSHREATTLDPQHRLLLEVAWEALENAGLPPHALQGSDTAVFLGLSSHDYSNINLGSGEFSAIDLYTLTGGIASTAAGRISYALDLHGPTLALDTACSSSLVAIHLACRSLRAGECRAALAGGVNLILSPENTIGLSQMRLLSSDGRCKAFDQAADGYVRSEGAGIAVLKRLSDAQADGDPILAIIRGSAVNHDGRSNALTAPNGRAQEQVIRAALEDAGVAPLAVRYVEAQGTGTPLGDTIEAEALAEVLGKGRRPEDPLLMGSVKTNLGHLEAAAGIAGLMKVVLALQHGAVPPHLHVAAPNGNIRWGEAGLDLVRVPTPLPTDGRPWICGVSAFGFNGTNAHVVLEAPPPAPAPVEARPPRARHVLTLSARCEVALQALAGRYARWIEAHSEADLADVCFTANAGRARFAHRAAVVISSHAEARERLDALARGEAAPGLWSGRAQGSARLALPEVPSTGAVSLAELHEAEPAAREILEQYAEPLRTWLAQPLATEPPAEALARLYVAGITPDFAAIDRPRAPRRLALPTYPFQRRRYWSDARAATAGGEVDAGEARTRAGDQANTAQKLAAWRSGRTVNSALLERLERATPAEAEALLADHIEAAVCRALALPTAPDRRRGFFDLGMESLTATELRGRLQADLGEAYTFSTTTLFDHPTIEALASHLAAELGLALADGQTVKARARRARHAEPIAVVGIGCRLPGAADPEAFWQLLRDGREAIRLVPPDRWDAEALYDPDPDAPGKTFARHGGFLDRIDRFDARFFGVAPREATTLDPQQRLLLEVAWEALEHAAIAPDRLFGSRTGVFVGVCGNDYMQLVTAEGLSAIDAYRGTGNTLSSAAGRLSYFLGLEGPSLVLDTACSSSLVAVQEACESLAAGQCDLALSGGVNLILTPDATINFTKARMLSPEGRCKTFDAAADGYVRAEGCGVVVLKRESDARRDGDRVLAVIRGWAVNQNGRSSGLTAPSGPAQARVIREAFARASIDPAAASYVEAHGTGTPLGDPIEVRAIAEALGHARDEARPVLLGSVKTNIGHLEGAAGVAGLLKVVLALQHGEIPPHLHFHRPSPHIPWSAIPVEIPTRLRPWPEGRRVAGVSSFGFNGTNAHVVLEAASAAPEARGPGTSARAPAWGRHVLTLSARSEPALAELAARYAAWLDADPQADLADVCSTANVGRAHMEHRAAMVVASREEALPALLALARGEPGGGSRGQARRAKVGFLFTGQGAQYAGMARELYEAEPVFRGVIDRCAEVVAGELDLPLTSILFGEDGPLRQTGHAQPALYALEVALAALWRSLGVAPAAVLGHSVGEYAAACVAGMVRLEDGMRLITRRARLMQALPTGGAMAAVFADAEAIRQAIARAPELEIAAENGESTVLSGPSAALEAALADLARGGIRVRRLETSHAFHSAAIEPMLDAFEAFAATIPYQPAALPLVSNVLGAPLRQVDAAYWRQHARAPVQFARGIEALADQGVDVLLELGPGPVLLGMAEACLAPRRPPPLLVSSLRRGRPDPHAVLEALADLYTSGVTPDFAALDRGAARRRLALPTYPFQRQRYWIERSPDAPIHAAPGEPRHPLLGERVALASGEVVHRTRLGGDAQLYLADHRVFDAIVVPGAVYAAMAVALGPRGCVRELSFTAALELGAGEPRAVQLVLSPPREDGRRSFALFSAGPPVGPEERELGARPGAGWTLHARGEWEPLEEAAPPPVALDDVRAHLAPRPVDALYQAFEAGGLHYGPAFRGIQALWTGDGEALAEIVRPAEIAPDGGLPIHPALLDACFQVLGGATGELREVFVPFQIETLALHAPAPERFYCLARLRPTTAPGAEVLGADLRLLGPDGSAFGEVRGLSCKRASRAALLGSARRDEADWLYEVTWREQALEGHIEPAHFLAGPTALAEGVGRAAARIAAEARLTPERREVASTLEDLGAAYVEQAFARLGGAPSAASDEALARHGIAPRHRRLVGRMLEIAARGPAPLDPAARLDEALARFPTGRVELTLLGRTGAQLAEVLRGAADPLAALFPEDGALSAEDLYRDTPVARFLSGVVQQAVAQAIEGLPAGRALRVLEIGAGTGATTEHLLPILPADRTEYVYTDISSAFFARVEERFAAYPFVTYRTLNVERDPRPQGFAERRFDLVVAANVLHATGDLERALAHVRSLLAPGGLLLIVEGTRRLAWLDLTFGLLEGWWRFEDAVRVDHPLLDVDAWTRLLRSMGFTEPVALPPAALDLDQTVLAARAPSELAEAERTGTWLVVAGPERDLAAAIVERLEARGGRGVIVEPGESYAALARDRYALPLASRDALSRLLGEALSADEALRGVVHLAAVASPEREEPSAGELEARMERAIAGVLALVQALSGRGARLPAGLWLLTRGAQALEGDASLCLSASPLWGLGKVIGLEHPELGCRLLDLDPLSRDREAERIVAELEGASGEDQIALRGSARRVPRLSRFGSARRLALPRGSYRLGVADKGTLEALRFEPVARTPIGPGEIEVRVRAAGLNFRDLLDALGAVQIDDLPLGGECAGEVIAVGEGVEGLRVGDRVLGMALGAFGDTARAPAPLWAQMPAGLRFAEAATIPVAFATAELAFSEQARLRPGQRVLIHAAAGGVGLAAIQLAQRLGAEIYATASEPKWGYLRSLGVNHVWSSRSLDFADAVRRATGGRGVDLVLNSLSGEFIERSLDLLVEGGTFVEIGKRGIWSPEQVAARRPDVDYQIVLLDRMVPREPERVGALLSAIVARFERGDLRPLRYVAYPMTEAPAAFRFMQQGRHIGKIVLRAAPPAGEELRGDASYLITGALGGLGLEVARWMVERGVRHLVLMGRRPPSVDAERRIDALRDAGCEVRLALADVSIEREVRRVLDDLRAEGPPLAGVFHAAGVLDDGALVNQSSGRFRTVFAPKVLGAWHLHRLTLDLDLDLFVLFSSAAALFGSAGQANHAAANMFLDVLAQSRRARGLAAVSIGWGAWSEIGAAAQPDAVKHVAGQGIGVIQPAQGLAALARILEAHATHVGVVPIDWPAYGRERGERPAPPMFAELLGRRGPAGARAEAERAPNPRPTPGHALGRAGEGDREGLFTALIRDEAARVLRLDPAELSVDRGFFEMGMDSLMAVEVRNRLQRQVGPLSSTALFDHPTITALARHLAASLPGGGHAPAAPSAEAQPGRRAREVEPLAIVGLGCRLPGAPDPEAFWSLLRDGVDAIGEVPPDRFRIDAWYDPDPDAPNKTYSRWGGFLEHVDRFDPLFFGISPREAASLDPQQRLLLEVSWEAFEHGGIPREKLHGSRTGVFVGIATSDYLHLQLSRAATPIDAYLGTGTSHSIAAGRISYALGLQGPSVAVDTACSSSLVALHQARQALIAGECDIALVAGVNVILLPQPMINFSKARLLSPEGRCKTFDASADGFVRSEGCGALVLKRLSDAQRDGDRILAVVRGSAVNQDGASSGLTVPNGLAQQRVIRDALTAADLDPSEVSYVEAHGTGTSLGDPIEVQALAAALASGRDPARPLRIGSVKTNIGHLEAAAGIAGVIKVVLALSHGEIPPHLHMRTPSPHIPWGDLAVQVPRERTPWPAGGPPRIAGVSSFGFGGTNAHVVLEEAPAAPAAGRASGEADARGHGRVPEGPPISPEREAEVLVLSARSEPALRASAARLAAWLEAHPSAALADVCFTAGAGRSHLEHRAALVVGSAAEARAGLLGLAQGASNDVHLGEVRSRPKVAFLFTGQGSQYAGMGQKLYELEPVFREVLDRLAERARGRLDRPLLDVILREGSPLDETEYTQPALFALEVALAALWRSWGITPDVVLGHSVGEYAAAAVAGVMSLEDGFDLVVSRGKLMQSLPPGGAMAAILGPPAAAEAALAAFPELSVAAHNGAHLVLSGPAPALEAALASLGDEAQVRRLVTSHAFHSALMEPILDALEAAARKITFRHGDIPLIENLTGGLLGAPPDASAWRRHAREPVQFAKSLATLADLGCEILLEIGPSPVLCGMAEDAWPTGKPPPVLVPSLRRRVGAAHQIAGALATLHLRGLTPDFAGLARPFAPRKLDLPTYPFERQRHWIEEITPEAAETRQGPGALAYELRWRAAAPEGPSEPAAKGTWLLLADRGGTGQALAEALEAQGQAYRLVPASTIDTDDPGALARLVAESGSGDQPLRSIVHLGSLDVPPIEAPGALDVAARVALMSAVHLARALAGRAAGPVPLWLVTRGAQLVQEGDVVDPAQAPLWGLGRVIGLEHPEIAVGLLDLPSGASSGQALVAALVARGGEDQIALRDGDRFVARLEPWEGRLGPAPLALDPAGSYLIAGGLGALGRHLVRRLVARGARHLVLLNRRPLPERARWSDPASLPAEDRPRVATLEWLEQRDVTACCVVVDIASRSTLEPLRKILAGAPPLRGVIHAAGVTRDAPLADLSRGALAEALASKGEGLLYLHELARDHALDFFVCTGSVAAILGGRGQGPYAAANAFVDAFAHYRRGLGLPALSVGYGPWSGGGMASAALRRAFTRTGVRPLAPAHALDALEALLASDAGQAAVADIDWARFKPVYEARRDRPVLAALGGEPLRPTERLAVREGSAARAPEERGQAEALLRRELEAAPPGERSGRLVAYLRRQLGEVLGLDPDTIRPQIGLFDMGLDSLMAVELKRRLERDLGGSLATGVIFAHPTCERLADHLARALAPAAPPPPADAATIAEEAIAELAREIEGLSEGEVFSMLEGQMAEVLGTGDVDE